MIVIAKSFLLTLVISFCVAFSLSSILSFWHVFSGVFAIQYIIAAVWKTYNLSKNYNIEEEYQQVIDDILEDITVIVKCPCGKNDIETVSNPNADIVVDCDVCANKIRIQHIIEPVLISQEVDMESVYDKLLSDKKKVLTN